MTEGAQRTGSGDSARRERLKDRALALTQALDDSQRELYELATQVRAATDDIQRAQRSMAWGMARVAGNITGIGTLGRSRLGVEKLDAAAEILRSLRSRLTSGPEPTRRTDRRLRITVVSWDMSHNGMIRAHYIADLFRRRYQVQHLGPCFPHFGTDVWAPARGSEVEVRTFPGCELPRFVSVAERFLEGTETDLVYVCKARFPSLLLGMLLKHLLGVPVILDLDEPELPFVQASGPISLDELEGQIDSPQARSPTSKLWTQASEGLVADADAVVIANEVLRPRFGGIVVPHVRDELTFDPSRVDRLAARAEFGYEPSDRVILFTGTANRHKGVLEVARALEDLGDSRLKLCIVGSLADREMRLELARAGASRTKLLDFVPLSEVPRMTAIADLVCLVQDPTSDTARYQTPAKLTEALAMGVPVLATDSPALRPFIEEGLIHVVGDDSLAGRISQLLADPGLLREQARRGRQYFLEHLSYTAASETLDPLIAGLQGTASEVGPGWSRTYELARRVPDRDARTTHRQIAPRGRTFAPGVQLDVALFWRLSYSGLYGRRPDMLIKYLAASPRTHKLVLFDRPTDWAWLQSRRRAAGSGVNHFDLVYRRARRLAWRAERDGKVTKHMFVAQPPSGATRWQSYLLPEADEYLGYVERALHREQMGSRRPLVFFVWPPMEHFSLLHEAFSPDLTIADVVDDERAWWKPASAAYQQITNNHREILAASDLVITHNQPLADRLRMFGVQSQLVANATELFARTRSARPHELRQFQGPIIGYSGNLSWRFDIALVDRLARERPDCQIVIIGSAHGSESVLILSRHPNVHFLGVKRYPEVARYISCFDVGIIPHLDDAMSRSMSPLKAYLYASCGVPAVSTEVANLVTLDSIRVTRTDDEFIAAVSEVIEQRRAGGLSLDPPSLLAGQTWQDRVHQLEGLIDDALAGRAAVDSVLG